MDLHYDEAKALQADLEHSHNGSKAGESINFRAACNICPTRWESNNIGKSGGARCRPQKHKIRRDPFGRTPGNDAIVLRQVRDDYTKENETVK